MSRLKDLLEEIRTTNLQDIEEFSATPLDEADVLAIREMLVSDGWKVMQDKIWGKLLKIYALAAMTSPTDQRFLQGKWYGYYTAIDQADWLTRSIDRLNEEQLQAELDEQMALYGNQVM